jgi:hypothetical protein
MKNALACILLIILLPACAGLHPAAVAGSADPALALMAPVNGYLVKEIGQATSGGKVFCAYDVLGTNVRSEKADVYVWALCAEYYLEGKNLTMGTASSLPVALHLLALGGAYRVASSKIPMDGMEYGTSIQRIFPAKAIQKMCRENADCYNERAKRLEDSTRQQAAEYYKVP